AKRPELISGPFSDSLLEYLRDLEADSLSGFDFDLLTRARIQTRSSFRFANRESSETGQRELSLFFQLFDDCFDEIVCGRTGKHLSYASGVLDDFRHKFSRHGVSSSRKGKKP